METMEFPEKDYIAAAEFAIENAKVEFPQITSADFLGTYQPSYGGLAVKLLVHSDTPLNVDHSVNGDTGWATYIAIHTAAGKAPDKAIFWIALRESIASDLEKVYQQVVR